MDSLIDSDIILYRIQEPGVGSDKQFRKEYRFIHIVSVATTQNNMAMTNGFDVGNIR